LDLLLLAAMAEQHEGHASVLATLHPRGEARMTVGLAAQILCPSMAERVQLRRLVIDGRAAAARLLELRDDGPFFNRSLELGPGVAALIQGATSWPSELVRAATIASPESIDRSGFVRWLARADIQRAIACLRERAEPPLLLLVADDLRTAGDRALALAAAAGRGSALLELSPEQAGNHQRALANQIIARDLVAVVVVDPPKPSELPGPLPAFVEGRPSVIVCTTRDHLRVESSAGRS